MIKIFGDTLNRLATLIPEKAKVFSSSFPGMASSAEAIHQGLDSLLYHHVKFENESKQALWASTMGFGAHSSWVTAYTLSASGLLESGLSEARRAIEFCCFAAKIAGNEKLVNAWLMQAQDDKARNKFISNFSIPLAYRDDKYSYLRRLIVAYDRANYFGPHANFEPLLLKYKQVVTKNSENESIRILEYSFFSDDIDIILTRTGYILILGYDILNAFKIILGPWIVEGEKLKDLFSFVEQQFKQARQEAAKHKFKDNVPDNIMRGINYDDMEFAERIFKEYVQKEESRKTKTPKKDNK